MDLVAEFPGPGFDLWPGALPASVPTLGVETLGAGVDEGARVCEMRIGGGLLKLDEARAALGLHPLRVPEATGR